MHKIHHNTYLYLSFIFIYFKNNRGHSQGETFSQECLQMFTGPVGPVEVFFYWPEAVFGNFYWPGAIGSPLASSPVNTMFISTFLPSFVVTWMKERVCLPHTHITHYCLVWGALKTS